MLDWSLSSGVPDVEQCKVGRHKKEGDVGFVPVNIVFGMLKVFRPLKYLPVGAIRSLDSEGKIKRSPPLFIGNACKQNAPQKREHHTLPYVEHCPEFMMRISDPYPMFSPKLIYKGRVFGLFYHCFWRCRLTNSLNSEGSGDSSSAEGKRLVGMLLDMLDERDQRLVFLATILQTLGRSMNDIKRSLLRWLEPHGSMYVPTNHIGKVGSSHLPHNYSKHHYLVD